MQTVDENHVGKRITFEHVDMELGGLDQRKIFCFSYDHKNERQGFTYLMNPIISLAKSGKMSASDINGKISFADSEELIRVKIEKAFCCDGDPDCGLMKLMKCVFFPLYENTREIEIISDSETISYGNYIEFEKGFINKVFLAVHLKKTITKLLDDLIAPLRLFLKRPRIQDIINRAYPNIN